MFSTSQDILYLTVSGCIALFTVFLIWIMYYIGQISRQSNEMITDFRKKMEELDDTMNEIKGKVTTSVDTLASVSNQIGTVLELIKSFAAKTRKGKS